MNNVIVKFQLPAAAYSTPAGQVLFGLSITDIEIATRSLLKHDCLSDLQIPVVLHQPSMRILSVV